MKVEYIIQYKNHPLGGWHDSYAGPAGLYNDTIEPFERELRARRALQPQREWRLIERTEEEIHVD